METVLVLVALFEALVLVALFEAFALGSEPSLLVLRTKGNLISVPIRK